MESNFIAIKGWIINLAMVEIILIGDDEIRFTFANSDFTLQKASGEPIDKFSPAEKYVLTEDEFEVVKGSFESKHLHYRIV
jgi:hypothetical protein